MTTRGEKGDKASKPGAYNYMDLLSEWQLTNKDFSWMDFAACKGADPEIFFAETNWQENHEIARSYCRKCTVYKNCMKFAIDNDINHGIWGGLSPSQRKMSRGSNVRE
jgi:WhiB family redox-sensing transcriptional regulator